MKIYSGTGRRKTAVAQVRLVQGSGKIIINDRTAEDYLPVEILRHTAFLPLKLTNNQSNFDTKINVRGGGMNGQVGAINLGVARALLEFDDTLRSALRNAGFLTRDPRMVERKKYGLKKARKRFQFSKR